MARLNAIATESSIANALILDSRDLFAREKYEERIDWQLAILTQQFYRTKKIDGQKIRQVVEEFVGDIEVILRDLEYAKRGAE